MSFVNPDTIGIHIVSSITYYRFVVSPLLGAFSFCANIQPSRLFDPISTGVQKTSRRATYMAPKKFLMPFLFLFRFFYYRTKMKYQKNFESTRWLNGKDCTRWRTREVYGRGYLAELLQPLSVPKRHDFRKGIQENDRKNCHKKCKKFSRKGCKVSVLTSEDTERFFRYINAKERFWQITIWALHYKVECYIINSTGNDITNFWKGW